MLRALIPEAFRDESLENVPTPIFIRRLKENLDRSKPFKITVDPKTARKPKRASVAIILSLKPKQLHQNATSITKSLTADLESFLKQDWVYDAIMDFVYIKRATRKGDRWSGQVRPFMTHSFIS